MPSPPDPLKLFVVASLAQLLAAVLAVALARPRPEHRAVARFFLLQVVANAAHEAIRLGVLVPAHALAGDGPLTGSARVAGHIFIALGLTWPAGLAAVALVVFSQRRPWWIAGLWVAVSVALAATYPASRGGVLARELLACELLAFVTVIYAIVTWWRRPGREDSHIEHLVLFLLLSAEVGLLFVAWRDNLFGGWVRAEIMLATIYLIVALFQGGALWAGRTSSSQSD